jgi:hypothetical protein
VLGVRRPRMRSNVYEYVRTQRADKIKNFTKIYTKEGNTIYKMFTTHTKRIFTKTLEHLHTYLKTQVFTKTQNKENLHKHPPT